MGFLEKRALFDLELEMNDGVIKTNRALLSAQSIFFEKMLHSQMKESQLNKIPFKSYSVDIVTKVLDCLIFGALEIDGDNLEQFLDIADYFDFGAVKQLCERWIRKNRRQIDLSVLVPLASRYHFSEVKNVLVKELLNKVVAARILIRRFCKSY